LLNLGYNIVDVVKCQGGLTFSAQCYILLPIMTFLLGNDTHVPAHCESNVSYLKTFSESKLLTNVKNSYSKAYHKTGRIETKKSIAQM
jgi:hypothetical protein